MKTVEDSLLARDERETWIPHQGAVAKYPKVVHRRGHIEAIAEESGSANGAEKIAALANVRAPRPCAPPRSFVDDLLVGRFLQNPSSLCGSRTAPWGARHIAELHERAMGR